MILPKDVTKQESLVVTQSLSVLWHILEESVSFQNMHPEKTISLIGSSFVVETGNELLISPHWVSKQTIKSLRELIDLFSSIVWRNQTPFSLVS